MIVDISCLANCRVFILGNFELFRYWRLVEFMSGKSIIGDHAVLIDRDSRFVTFMGEVVENGDVLKLRNIYDTEKYNKNALLRMVEDYGLSLVFLPPAMRLPTAPACLLDQFYEALPRTRLSFD